MAGKFFFIDTTRCTACRGCQTACKQYKKHGVTKTKQYGTYQNPPDLDGNTFRLVREVLTGSDPQEILDASQAWSAQTGKASFSLVACTGSRFLQDREPRGGIAFRIISTFEIVKWEDLG